MPLHCWKRLKSLIAECADRVIAEIITNHENRQSVEVIFAWKAGEGGMTNEAVVYILIITIFVFSVWLACGISSLSQKLDRIEAIINILRNRQEGR